MAIKRRKSLARTLARWLGRADSEIRVIQEARQIRQVARFAGIFGVTVLIPAIMLAYFALSSIQAEELLVDADLARAADSVSAQIYRDVDSEFTRFEESTTERLRSGQSPLTTLAELSPFLRGAFRFDESGVLAAPFTLPDTVPVPEPPLAYRIATQRGQDAERTGDFAEALAHYETAVSRGAHPAHVGSASYNRARLLAKNGQIRESEEALADVYADFANVREVHGFRLGDLATLKRAEMAWQREPDVGAVALEGLAEELISARWTIGRPGEAAIARRALDSLAEHSDTDWLARARITLDERTRQLFWAEALESELELFRGATMRVSQGEFKYYSRPDSGSLWATLYTGTDLYAFSFDQDAIIERLKENLVHANTLEDQITAWLSSSQKRKDNSVLDRRSLAPWLPFLNVVVQPDNPERLASLKRSKRTRRIFIIVLAMAIAVLGVALSARIVSTELEGARAKADFAANVSHELRSPITQIRLKGEALQLDLVYDDEDRRAHHDAIVREAERLSRLVDNILDFAAIERGAKTYMLRQDDLGEIMHSQIRSARDYIESRGIELSVDIANDLPVIWVDREAVGQVITNLLSNAAKYGSEGKWIGVVARVGLEGIDISVSDRGIGISKEDLRKLFVPFFRSADPQVRRKKGTGIGLNIVRYIVEEHGGSISAESTLNEGTTFTVTFPFEPPSGAGV